MPASARTRLTALERRNSTDPIEALSDAELVALAEIARLQLGGRMQAADALFSEQPTPTQHRMLAAIASLKDERHEKP